MAKSEVRPAPPGYRWVFCTHYFNKQAGRVLYAADYGYDSWRFLVRA